MQAYCVKCRAKREMKNPKTITMKNKKPATVIKILFNYVTLFSL